MAPFESGWAPRVKQAGRQAGEAGLEEVDWAREILKDPERRVRADAGSLNVDTVDRVLYKLSERFSGQGGGAAWQPRDCEKDLREYTIPVEMPDVEALRAEIVVPMPTRETPAVARLLEEFARAAAAIDPWNMQPTEEPAP